MIIITNHMAGAKMRKSEDDFRRQHNRNFREAIGIAREYKDLVEIDLTGKILVVPECYVPTGHKTPINISQIYIPEECNKNAKLYYDGCTAFLLYENQSGTETWFYKDDECYPCEGIEEYVENNGDVDYCCEENQFKVSDIGKQIEAVIKGHYDFNYILDEENLVFIQGL